MGDRVLRTVLPPGREDYEFARDSGLLQTLSARGQLVRAEEVALDSLPAEASRACYVLAHPRLEVPSYPYEWSFSGLKDAALLQLDIHLEALGAGLTLSDSSAYNVMFDGPSPIFIDYLSFRRYREGEFWSGHRQFCEQFLNPLLLTAFTGVPHQDWYRGALEGIPANLLARVLPLRRYASWRVFTHVLLQASMQKPSATVHAVRVSQMKLPLDGFRRMLESLRAWVASLEPSRHRPSLWAEYASSNSYTSTEAELKRGLVQQFASSVRPRLLLDLGCNTGEYSKAALTAGAVTAIGWESDHGALDASHARAKAEGFRLLPLYADPMNPSPSQGWDLRERGSLPDRIAADAVFALAFIHHLAIARNVPLEAVVAWVMERSPQGILEFVPKADPMVQRLLQLRADIFPDYSEEAFLAHVASRGEVVRSVRLPRSGRLLVWYRRR